MYVALNRLFRRKTVIINNPDGGVINDTDKGVKRKSFYDFAVKHTDLFIPWSSWAAEEIRNTFPQVPEEKIVVMHPGINLKDWPMRPPHTPGQRFKILFVGGDIVRKGGDTLLDAFTASLHDNCELSIATQTGYLPPALRERIEQTPHVSLHLDLTSKSELFKQLYREADCFVLPTRNDSSSWVALESLATGIPVIISRTGGIPDIVIDQQTGLTVPPDNPQAIIEAVRRLQHDPLFTERLIRQGRDHVEKNFNSEKNTQRFLNIIKTLVDKRRNQV
ncbi:glycosyltransferase family 4 protein [Candidatus Oscillochloris fontis]|uniref:glycosyltransferase family 4 protein n=1 Tax=Candidatus Oscillochloris fontis TaxID=2496868 RepID=UPI00101DC085|nr:glycosyltransferase family 4 protein [Candidatus Oscillochloris fontis]